MASKNNEHPSHEQLPGISHAEEMLPHGLKAVHLIEPSFSKELAGYRSWSKKGRLNAVDTVANGAEAPLNMVYQTGNGNVVVRKVAEKGIEFRALKEKLEGLGNLGIPFQKPLAIVKSNDGGIELISRLDKDNVPLCQIITKIEGKRRDKVFSSVFDALKELHSNGVVHGDLNLGSIILHEKQGKASFVLGEHLGLDGKSGSSFYPAFLRQMAEEDTEANHRCLDVAFLQFYLGLAGVNDAAKVVSKNYPRSSDFLAKVNRFLSVLNNRYQELN